MRFEWIRKLAGVAGNIFPGFPSKKTTSSPGTKPAGTTAPPITAGGKALVTHTSLQNSPYKLRESFKEVYNLFHTLVGENDEQKLFDQITNINYKVTKQLVDATLDNPIISNEWKIWISASRIQDLTSDFDSLPKIANKTEVIDLIKKTKGFAIDLLKTEGNNPDAIKFILEKENRKTESQLKIKTFCVASVLAACDLEKIKSDDKELLAILDTLSISQNDGQVKFKSTGKGEAYANMTFILPDDYNAPASSLFVSIFHEREHQPLITKYNLHSLTLHGGAISEFRCDLGSIKNVAKYIDSSTERLNLSRLEYKFPERYNMVYKDASGYSCCKYAVARAFFESILRGWEKSGLDKITLVELCDELEKGTEKILQRHPRNNIVNELRFSQFAEELIGETKDFFAAKGISVEINYPKEKLTSKLFREKMNYINPDKEFFGVYLYVNEAIPEEELQRAIDEMYHITSVPLVRMTKNL